MKLEHVNVTVTDAKATAAQLRQIFDWQVRWEGASMDGGYTVHIGDESSYIAFYAPAHDLKRAGPKYKENGSINHVGVLVPDLDAVEAKVAAAGYQPRSHYDYEPGRRFYFDGPGGVEYEVVSYAG